MDNTTVVSYINKQGGTLSHPMLRLVVDLFLQSQDIIHRARHIPCCLNMIAEHLSRPNQPIMTEWSLHPKIMAQIFGTLGTPGTSVCHKTGRGGRCTFPPFPLLNKVIRNYGPPTISLAQQGYSKLRATQDGEIILIAPWWASLPWFPHLLCLCVDHLSFHTT